MGLSFCSVGHASVPNAHQDHDIQDLQQTLTTGGFPEYDKRLCEMLRDGKFAELDDYFTSLQDAYEGGKINDVLLFFAYSPLSYSYTTYFTQVANQNYDPLFSKCVWTGDAF